MPIIQGLKSTKLTTQGYGPAAGGGSMSTTVVLDPVGEGSWDRGSPTTTADHINNGSQILPTGEFGGSQCNRGWLMWDTWHIPPDAIVSAASLDLTVNSNFLGASHTLNLYRCKVRGWSGQANTSGVTAGHAASFYSWNGFTIPGGDDTTSDRDATPIGSLAITSATSGKKTITLDPTLVQGWLSGAFVNNGLMLVASVETASSNSLMRWQTVNNATAANRPRLTITYTSVLESKQITDGLVAYYKLDDTSDSSGNAHTLTNTNGTTFVAGKFGNAAHFVTASSQRLTNTDAALKPGASTSWTCVFWVKLTDLADLYTIASQWNGAVDGTGGGWRVFYHCLAKTGLDYIVAQFNDGGGSAEVSDVIGYTSGAIGSAGTYIMVALRHDAARKNLHLGFNASMSKANSTQSHNSGQQWGPYLATYIPVTDAFTIGAESNGAGGFRGYTNGDVDNVGYWNRWLTDAEISTTLYNGGAGLELSVGGGGGGAIRRRRGRFGFGLLGRLGL